MAIYIEKKYQKVPLGAVVEDSMASGSKTNAPSINAVKNAISNPNLLINGDFSIWQRGTSFNTSNKYAADRWLVMGQGVSVAKNTHGLALDSTLNEHYLIQYMENDLRGETVTLSFEYTIGTTRTKLSKTIEVIETSNIYELNSNVAVAVYYDTNRNATCCWFRIRNNITVLHYVKLEEGSVATAFASRPYTEEKLLCDRYYQRAFITIPVLNNQGGYYEFPIEMRSAPTVTYDSISFGVAGSALQTSFNGSTVYVSSETFDRIIFAQNFRDGVVALRCLAYCDAEIY